MINRIVKDLGKSVKIEFILRDRLTVGQRTLDPFTMVRIHVPQPIRLAALAHGYSRERIVLSQQSESKEYVSCLHSS